MICFQLISRKHHLTELSHQSVLSLSYYLSKLTKWNLHRSGQILKATPLIFSEPLDCILGIDNVHEQFHKILEQMKLPWVCKESVVDLWYSIVREIDTSKCSLESALDVFIDIDVSYIVSAFFFS